MRVLSLLRMPKYVCTISLLYHLWPNAKRSSPVSVVSPLQLFHRNVVVLDCKTVVFFLKISKEIGKAWRKSAREPHTPVGRVRREKASFDCSRILEYAKIRTVLQSIVVCKRWYSMYCQPLLAVNIEAVLISLNLICVAVSVGHVYVFIFRFVKSSVGKAKVAVLTFYR